MKKKQNLPRPARISDAAVEAKTGKNWRQWFAILDAAGAMKMNHKEIVAYLSKKHRVEPWWQQMVTVTYEQTRGMREKHLKSEGYEISVTRTMSVPIGSLYKAWKDERLRHRWIPATPIVIRKATAGKSMRITWKDRKTSLDVSFYPRKNKKCQVTVQHSKLPDAHAATRMKAYWGKSLDRLKELLEN